MQIALTPFSIQSSVTFHLALSEPHHLKISPHHLILVPLAGKWCPQGQTSSAFSATTSRRPSRRRRRRRRRSRSRWTPWASSACRTSCSERLGRTRRTFWQSTHSWRGTTQAKQFEVGMVGAKTDCGEYHVKISFGWGWVKDHVTAKNLTLSSKPTSIWLL